MPFPSHLHGLNTFLPADGSSGGGFDAPAAGFSDAELAETLALWTNVEFSFDDGGVGLGSGLKLVEEDERLAREAAAAAAQQQQQQQQWAAPAPALTQQQQQHQPLSLENFDFSSLPGYPGAAPAAAPSAAGMKRKLSVSASGRPSPGSFEDEVSTNKSPAALSAEEDKRRRNTEASARFRAKKKEREAALEKSARELQSRTAALEKEVETLRRENTWLKGLVIAGEGVKAEQAGVH